MVLRELQPAIERTLRDMGLLNEGRLRVAATLQDALALRDLTASAAHAAES